MQPLKKVQCDNCGTEFDKITIYVREDRNNFCSAKCSYQFHKVKSTGPLYQRKKLSKIGKSYLDYLKEKAVTSYYYESAYKIKKSEEDQKNHKAKLSTGNYGQND